MIFSFRDVELDEERIELRRGGRRVAVEPKVFELLLALARVPGRLVTRAELLHQLWGEVAVSDWALARVVKEARKAVGDSGEAQGVIGTVRGRGYRLVASVRHQRVAAAGRPPAQPSALPRESAVADRDPYVGRARALRELEAKLVEADAGTGRIVLIAGDAGMGKTRMVREVAARLPDLLAVYGWCEEGIGAPPLWPWSQILRRMVSDGRLLDPAVIPSPWRETLARADAPDPSRRSGAREDDWLLEPAARLRVFAAVADALLAASRARTLLLVLEDLQWADGASLALLEFLASRICEGRIALIGTYRPGDVHPGRTFALALGRIAAQPHARSIALTGLEAGDVYTLARTVAGRAPAPELVAGLLARSGGNPFFVRELAAQVALPGGSLERLPLSVRALGARRLERLSAETRRRLGLAAVCGERFELRWVEALTEDAARGREWLQEALDGGVLAIEPSGSGRLAFRHALLRETIDELLDFGERARLHRRLGKLLETEFPDPSGEQLDLLARHFAAALPDEKDAERAIGYALRAADAAARRLAWDDVERHASSALQWLEERPPSVSRDAARLDALLLRAAGWSANQNAGHEVRDALERAAELAERVGGPARQARLATLSLLFATLQGRYREACVTIARLRERGAPGLVRTLRACEATLDTFEGRFGPARTAGAELVAEEEGGAPAPAPEIGIDPEVLALSVAPIAAWACGEDEVALQWLRRALARSERDPSAHAFSLFMGSVLHDLRRDAPALLELAARIDPLCIRHHVPAFTGAGSMFTGLALDALGRGAAFPYAFSFDVLRGMTRSESPPRLRTFVFSVAARFACRADRLGAAASAVTEALRYAADTGERFLLAELLRLDARICDARGDGAGAREALEQALAVAREQGAIRFEVRALAALCRRDDATPARLAALRERAGALGSALRGPERSEIEALLGASLPPD